LAEPSAWPGALADALGRDRAAGASTIGPHRDDLALDLGPVPLRVAGSTGQHRTAAIALKLAEWDTLRDVHRGPPALLLDDVFAELDRDRQDRLAARLLREPGCQVFVTAPRPDELPPALHLPIFDVTLGAVSPRSAARAA
jgi:DNA replication and repair protein RecF